MAYEANPGEVSAVRAVGRSEALRLAWRIAWTTRLAVVLVAVFAALSFGPAAGGLAEENAGKFDEPALTGALADAYRIAGINLMLFGTLMSALCAVGLGLFTAQYASWHWIS
jgi:hypothetical protein